LGGIKKERVNYSGVTERRDYVRLDSFNLFFLTTIRGVHLRFEGPKGNFQGVGKITLIVEGEL